MDRKVQNAKLKVQIDRFFSEVIKPKIQLDGGDIYLVAVEPSSDGFIVKVSLEGACRGCGLSSITLQMGVEASVREKFPEVKSVELVD